MAIDLIRAAYTIDEARRAAHAKDMKTVIEKHHDLMAMVITEARCGELDQRGKSYAGPVHGKVPVKWVQQFEDQYLGQPEGMLVTILMLKIKDENAYAIQIRVNDVDASTCDKDYPIVSHTQRVKADSWAEASRGAYHLLRRYVWDGMVPADPRPNGNPVINLFTTFKKTGQWDGAKEK